MPGHDHDTTLETLNIWPRSALDRLGAAGIVMADHLIAVAHTDGGAVSLGQQAGLAPDETRRLIADTQAALATTDPGRSDPGPVDTHDFGTGALGPDE